MRGSMRIVLAMAALALTGAAAPGGTARTAWGQQDELVVGSYAVIASTDGGGLRLRGGPGLNYPVQATLGESVRVQVLEGPQAADGHQWYRVSAGSASGWGSSRYLTMNERGYLLGAAGPLPPSQGRSLSMRVVGYNLGGGGATRTASGTSPRWGTVAVDPQVIPLGSRLLIDGFDGVVFLAEDTGSAVRGQIVDIWFDDPAAARRFGTQTRTVTILDR